MHGVAVDEDHERFFITRPPEHSSKWDDSDIHIGSAIWRKLCNVEKFKTAKFTDYGTKPNHSTAIKTKKKHSKLEKNYSFRLST